MTTGFLECPFCPREGHRHRLRLHGRYARWVLLPGGETELVPVLRLLCARQGRTVSLLPDFCHPRRQHGPGVLGQFLKAILLEGKGLLAALQEARPDALWHSVAQGLLASFEARQTRLQSYLAGCQLRAAELASEVPASRRPLARLVAGLLLGQIR